MERLPGIVAEIFEYLTKMMCPGACLHPEQDKVAKRTSTLAIRLHMTEHDDHAAIVKGNDRERVFPNFKSSVLRGMSRVGQQRPSNDVSPMSAINPKSGAKADICICAIGDNPSRF